MNLWQTKFHHEESYRTSSDQQRRWSKSTQAEGCNFGFCCSTRFWTCRQGNKDRICSRFALDPPKKWDWNCTYVFVVHRCESVVNCYCLGELAVFYKIIHCSFESNLILNWVCCLFYKLTPQTHHLSFRKFALLQLKSVFFQICNLVFDARRAAEGKNA